MLAGWTTVGLHSLGYHALILVGSRGAWLGFRRPRKSRAVWLALLAAAGGPLGYVLLPHMAHADLTTLLNDHHLSRLSLTVMVPCFGLVHPVLEQVHWADLQQQCHWGHLLFAGYHMLVLYSLLELPWLVICFLTLAAASWFWRYLQRVTGNLLPAILSHVLADFGIILAAWLLQGTAG